jgi:hypothetical protein
MCLRRRSNKCDLRTDGLFTTKTSRWDDKGECDEEKKEKGGGGGCEARAKNFFTPSE